MTRTRNENKGTDAKPLHAKKPNDAPADSPPIEVMPVAASPAYGGSPTPDAAKKSE
jgi:hypothetical protein